MAVVRRIVRQREFVLFASIVLVFIVMTFASPVFLTSGNITAMLLGLSIDAIVAIGMTLLLVSGGFDLSVGSGVAIAGAICAILLNAGSPPLISILAAMAFLALVGVVYGFLIARVGLNAFVTTLAGLSILRGLTYIITNGSNQVIADPAFAIIGRGQLLGIQAPIWYVLIAVIIGDVLLRRNRFFRRNYFIGSNEKAARLSGIPVTRMKTFNYVFMGLITAAAGIILAGRVGAATITAGTGLELRVITAVVIGGASLSGGEGSVLGSFLGCLLLVLINDILTLFGVGIYWQTLAIGVVLFLAVLIDRIGILVRERSALHQRSQQRSADQVFPGAAIPAEVFRPAVEQAVTEPSDTQRGPV